MSTDKNEPVDSGLTAEWIVEFIYEQPVIDRSPASINFVEDNVLAGNASCNRYFGTYAQEDSNLTLNVTGKTNKMCILDSLMEQEARFLAALPQVTSFEIREGILFLLDEDGEAAFRAAQHN